MKTLLFISTLFLLSAAQALTAAFPKPSTGVFSSYDILTVKLTAPLSTLLKAKELPMFLDTKKVVVEGVLTYTNEHQQKISVPVKINIKGFSSVTQCNFPKLELKFDKNLKKNTLFENTKSIDLNTHCFELDAPNGDDLLKASFYAHREALIYRMMDILEMPAFRARPIMIEYEDTDIPATTAVKQHTPYYAFFLEDYGDFRKRNNLKAIRAVNDVARTITDPQDTEKMASFLFTAIEDHPQIDKEDVVRTNLLLYLMGSYDHFIKRTASDERYPGGEDRLWNIKIVENAEGKWITLPQDFNYSFFVVNPEWIYPMPVKELEGLNLISEDAQQKIFKNFFSKKAELVKAVEVLRPEDAAIRKQRIESMLQNIEALIK